MYRVRFIHTHISAHAMYGVRFTHTHLSTHYVRCPLHTHTSQHTLCAVSASYTHTHISAHTMYGVRFIHTHISAHTMYGVRFIHTHTSAHYVRCPLLSDLLHYAPTPSPLSDMHSLSSGKPGDQNRRSLSDHSYLHRRRNVSLSISGPPCPPPTLEAPLDTAVLPARAR
jgi:hypothetical protein